MNNILLEQAESIIDLSVPSISNISNLLSFLFYELDHINWIGFYYIDCQNSRCYLGPFQGKFACTTIPFGQGVVGTCATCKTLLNISDVHSFQGHIACDSCSNSELVIPIFKNDELFAILDIDSPIYSRFDSNLQQFFLKISHLFENLF